VQRVDEASSSVTTPRNGAGRAATPTLISRLAREHPRRTILLVSLLVLSGLAEGVGVASMLPLLEMATPASGQEPTGLSRAVEHALAVIGLRLSIGVLLAVIAAGMVLKAVFRVLAMRQVGFAVAQVASELRLRLIRALLGARWEVFVGQQSGRFSNAIAWEADRAAGLYRNVCSLISSLVQVLVYATLAFVVSWKMAIAGLVAGIVIIGVLSGLVALAREAGESQTRLMRSLIIRLTDALQGVKPIKAMGREGSLQPLLEAETVGINRAKQREVVASEALNSAQEPILVILLAAGLYAVLAFGRHSLPAVLVLGFLFYRLAGRISVVQIDYQAISVGESAYRSMIATINEVQSTSEPDLPGRPVVEFQDRIVFDNVRFAYGEHALFDDLSFEIPAGTFTALVGTSGAGKTTIADLVVGLYVPAAGRITIDGCDLRQVDQRAWRRSIGYVPQEMFLFHDTLLKNVTLGDDGISPADVEAALIAAGAWDFVSHLPAGMHTVVGERGAKLSGGQRQRIAIARALVTRPRLLILDEVTTSLDPATEKAICDTLAGLTGTTILAITHQQALVGLAHQVIRVAGGNADVVDRAAVAS
jgi:ATP-binding cassette, subfamily C, bacterial